MSAASARRVPLAGSERQVLAGAHAVGPSDRAEQVEVSVHLRPRAPLPAPGETRMTRAQFAARHGASPDDVVRVAAFADAHGLRVEAAHQARRSVVLSGTAAALGAAFDVELQRWERDGTSFRGRTGPVHIPRELAGAIEGVFGLDDRPQTRSRIARRARRARRAHGTSDGLTPVQVAHLYDFPAHLDGGGQTVALLQVSGGYEAADLRPFFDALHRETPRTVDVSVDHGRNARSGDPQSDDSEVQLDVEVLGAVAPGARIVLYFAPNTERGFLDGIGAAIHDARLRPSVLSISWGAAEASWTLQALHAIDGAFAAAAALGVTVCAAAGDSGSGDDLHDHRPHADFPASSPGALACGGTRVHLHHGGSLAGEEVWNDGRAGGSTGGGVSAVFAAPPWQQSLGLHGRGVPDVAGDADPDTGYAVRVDGVDQILGGTSAVAPLWAALVALANQRRRTPVGLLAPLLYAEAAGSALRDVTRGRNGAYAARPGWDACTGLGTPHGGRLVELLADP